MAEKRSQDEPSIEEILGSIRRIIAEDDDGAAPAAADTAEQADDAEAVAAPVADIGFSAEEEDEEPLELTNRIDTPPVFNTAAASDDGADIAFEPHKEPSNTRDEEAPMATTRNQVADSILSATTADATAAVMAKLTRQTVISDATRGGGQTIEDMVRDMLKPMLRDWLDQNLPGLVQKMVERELERLSSRI